MENNTSVNNNSDEERDQNLANLISATRARIRKWGNSDAAKRRRAAMEMHHEFHGSNYVQKDTPLSKYIRENIKTITPQEGGHKKTRLYKKKAKGNKKTQKSKKKQKSKNQSFVNRNKRKLNSNNK